MYRRILVKGGSGAGKTTLSRELERRLGLPHVELDALHHGPNWRGATAEELQAHVRAKLDDERGWIVDGNYESKIGRLVLERAEVIVWLDLPLRTKLAQLARRTARRLWHDEELWNGNRESFKDVFYGFDGLFAWAIRTHYSYRRTWPELFRGQRVIRLRSRREVNAWLAELG
jgi:adenylate kinase family enzyme